MVFVDIFFKNKYVTDTYTNTYLMSTVIYNELTICCNPLLSDAVFIQYIIH